jgi:hypothetical protein
VPTEGKLPSIDENDNADNSDDEQDKDDGYEKGQSTWNMNQVALGLSAVTQAAPTSNPNISSSSGTKKNRKGSQNENRHCYQYLNAEALARQGQISYKFL